MKKLHEKHINPDYLLATHPLSHAGGKNLFIPNGQSRINGSLHKAADGLLNFVSFVWLLSVLFLLTLFPMHAHSAGKIVKWKDDKGVTHYGDNMPAQYASSESSEISKQGITVKRNKPIHPQDQVADAAKQEQDKKDRALTSAFTSAMEIDLARDRNLQLDLVAVESLELQRKNSLKKLAENQSFANSLTKRKIPIPDDLSTDVKRNQAEIAKQTQQINERKATMESTRKRFDDDKVRFIALKNNTNEAGTSSP